MKDFVSKTLNRTFATIVFGQVVGAAGASAPAAAGGDSSLPAGHPPLNGAMGGASAGVDASKIQVAKATGADAKTVAEVFAQKSALKDKPITVNGVVVKFNPGIMKKNWFHIQDGSGKADQKTNDLTVTTDGTVKVGDKVQVKGNLTVDKDFGAGYKYGVILENAAVQPIK
jgi:hypothetical protein